MKKLILLSLSIAAFNSCQKDRTTQANPNGSINNGAIVSDVDGNRYNVVTIGSQVWMAENLRTTHYRNGDPISNITDGFQWNSSVAAWCYYNNDSQYDTVYGKLYNWYAVADPRNICPIGWHIPTESDWNILIKYIDNNADTSEYTSGTSFVQSTIAGGYLKSLSYRWASPNLGATNSTGFNGLPGGHRAGSINSIDSSSFNYSGIEACWWSANSFGPGVYEAWTHYTRYNVSSINRVWHLKRYGYSVRCVKD